MRKLLILILALCICLPLGVSATEAEYEDTLRVGIYYGASALGNVGFENSAGFDFGIFKDREFVALGNTESTSVKVDFNKFEGECAHHVDYETFENPDDARDFAAQLQEMGIDAFAAYINGKYHTLSGFYKNNNDALWAAENLEVKGTPFVSSNNALRLRDSSGKTIFMVDDALCGVTVYPTAKAEDETEPPLTHLSGGASGTYRGGFECRQLETGKITLVNTVGVEDYLYSVVCREMSSSWPVEALKAQAVCARNFALRRINYHSKYGFDVCKTVCCQAYSQDADTSESVHTAVDETRGELLFCGDDLVQAVYSSSMGAKTESVEYVWGSKFSYLVSVDNPYEDTDNIYNGKWTKTLTKARATQIAADKGWNIGDVTDITVVERTPAGSVLKLKVQGTGGSKILERESCRTTFSEATYSQRYDVSLGGQTVEPTVYIATGDGKVSSSKLSGLSVMGTNGKISALDKLCNVFNGIKNNLFKSTVTDGDSNTFVFSGEGWGHGVGMSQYGAKGMAEAGFTYDEILTHYYTGTHLEQAY